MPRCLTIQRTLVTPPDRDEVRRAAAAQARDYYAQAGCRFWVFEEAGLPGAFLEFFEAPDADDARARARRRRPSACSTRRASTTKWSCRNMPTRSLTNDGRTWRVMPSGRVTQYDRDEFALLFVSGTGDDREVRVTRYSPHGTRSREQSLAELSDAELRGSSTSRSRATPRPRPATRRDRDRRGPARRRVRRPAHALHRVRRLACAGGRRRAPRRRPGSPRIALTDHDTVAGLAEARAAGARARRARRDRRRAERAWRGTSRPTSSACTCATRRAWSASSPRCARCAIAARRRDRRSGSTRSA